MEPVRAVLDPETWERFVKEAGISHRQRAFLHKSRLIVEVVSVEVQAVSELHAHAVDRSTLTTLLAKLFQGTVPWRVVARERSELLTPEAAAALSAFVRRHPKRVRLDPLEVLRIVTRDDFRCRICGAQVEARPRAVVRIEDEQGAESELITVCDPCRLDLLRSRRQDDPGPGDG